MNFLLNLGFNSFKIYMNLGSSVNRILADLEPPRSEIDEMEVNMTDDLLVKIAKNSAALNSLLIVHAEDHKVCSRMMNNLSVVSNDENHNLLEIWSKARPTSSEVSSISKITMGSLIL
jgi:dihydroorotase-like cyclic amidohydrolase